MKKFVVLIVAGALSATLLAGCQDNTPKATATPSPQPTTEAPATTSPAPTETATATEAAASEAPAVGGSLKTGLAAIGSNGNSKKADGGDGLAQTDINIGAITLDANGKITGLKIDAVQSKVSFAASGKITSDVSAAVPTKVELGNNYGMSKASSIQKDWDAQIAAFEAFCIGKTVDEVKGMALTEKGSPAEADLVSGCTMNVQGYIALVEKAAANAKEMGAQEGDKVGLGISTKLDKSKDAGESDGLAQAYATFVATTVDGSGKITSAILDSMQGNVNFDAKGNVTTDLAVAPQTKNELGAAYGMKVASKIGKEWDEQAAAFSQYVVGKTAADVTGIAVDDAGKATDADLVSSVTVGIGEFKEIVEKAANTAK